jgi:L,D-peptidoglycan transpeptidase YkuD (ErfK/YbiS/YcfS/YnhG family)
MKRIKYLLMVIFFSGMHSFASLNAEYKTNTDNDIVQESTNPAIESIPEGPVPRLFEKILALNQARIGNSAQIVLVTNEYLGSPKANIQTFEKINGQWVEKFDNIPGTVGISGFARYKEKKEGDKKTPTGIFFLGPVYTYPQVKVSTKMERWEAGKNDYWIDDINSAQYNRWVTSNSDPKNNNVSREVMMREDGKYKYGIAIQYNMDQVKGKGSVITVHVLIGNKGTVGCIAIPQEELIDIIGWLDRAKNPLIIMGTEQELVTKPVSGPGLDKNDKYIWKKEQYASPAR